ncbi:MAG: nucleoside monophosphate kinase [Candidatus Omnitrophica bacterium]|nr:nucleoside monophosphate kinase [Candidatus Omnitrophota bacterium]
MVATDTKMILFGAPGSGKGTQALKLAKELKLKSISLGDILRLEVSKASDLGKQVHEYMQKGLLVPDGLVSKVIEENLISGGFILDGYPRNLDQAKTLDDILTRKNLKLDFFIYLEIDENTITKRLLKRGRGDDDPLVIKKRWEVFIEECNKILKHYKNKKKLIIVDGRGGIDEVFSRIKDVLK